MSLIDLKIDFAIETKRLLKTALQLKGQAVTDQDTLRSYAEKIENIVVLNAQTKTVNPSLSSQEVIPSIPYNSLDKVIINPVTAAVDANIRPENIRKGITILGVTGTMEEKENLNVELTALENQTQLLQNAIDSKMADSE